MGGRKVPNRPPLRMGSRPAEIDNPTRPGLIRIGRLIGVHALKGALRFKPDNPDSEALDTVTRIFVEVSGELREYAIIEAARVGHGPIRLVLEGIDHVDKAEALKGATV